MIDYDVIVIGAGPAGSTVAKTAANAGYSVLMLEKKSSCNSPCAGYVGNTINTELPENCTVQSRITGMRTYFPDMTFHDFPLNGFVVDRPSFDMALAEEAQNCGVDIRWSSPLTDLTPDGVRFKGGETSAKIIVGADGVFSKTTSLLGLVRQDIAVCAQYHLKGIEPLENTSEIFFNADYAPGAYAWIYPSGPDSAKVGLGITTTTTDVTGGSRSVHDYLDAFIDESEVAKRLLGCEKTEYTVGALPVGGLRENLCIGNVMLVGDSAGMADPITGAGINSAILAGEVAGKAIINALEKDDPALLARYERQVRRLLERPLTRSLEKRGRMDILGAPNEVLQKRLPELWVTFKEYWG